MPISLRETDGKLNVQLHCLLFALEETEIFSLDRNSEKMFNYQLKQLINNPNNMLCNKV